MLLDVFPELIEAEYESSSSEFYVHLRGADPRPVLEYLRKELATRLVAVFAEDRRAAEGVFYNYYVIEKPGEPSYMLLRASISPEAPRFPSLSPQFPALNWQEREIQDWFGLEALNHPNPRRVALHDNWPEVHPLLREFPVDEVLPAFEGERHLFRPAEGEGVFQVPVGPVHAGIIEPGHFNFAVAGEPVLYLQIRLFYTHKGTEKLFEHMPASQGVFLAESISGDSSFSHAIAFCQAVENAGEITVPARARFMRTILLELERLYNHVGDIGAIATDVGFGVANAHAARLRELLMALNEEITGSRLLRGMARIGGVRHDWDWNQLAAIRDQTGRFEEDFAGLVHLLESSESMRDRLEHTGVLPPDKARDLGVVGVAGRASGVDQDVRRDHPYAAYERFAVHVPLFETGDVWHRMQVRIHEARESVRLLRAALKELPEGEIRARRGGLEPGRCGLGVVEGWRGEILHWVRAGIDGRLDRCKIKDPSLNNWPALVEAIQGNIIADFPVINKSFNLSYSGTDR